MEAKEVARESSGVFGLHDIVPDRIVDALLAAGLLRTGVERDAVEACKRYGSEYNVASFMSNETCRIVADAGRAALEAEKPRPRWGAMSEFPDEPQYPERWGVWDMTGKPGEYAKVSGLTRKQALAVADCLNALEGGAR